MAVAFSPMRSPLLTAFGETVTYHPRKGSPRSMSAVVVRELPQGMPFDPRAVRHVYEVHVANDATTGIDVTALDTGGDTFTVKQRLGGDDVKVAVMRLLQHDDGMLALEVR